ncbi:hypothetical protein KC345_g11873, partial [Hortaea werneckii]
VMKNGLYHAYRLAIAPTASISYIQNATSSVMPIVEQIETRTYANSTTYYPMPYLRPDNVFFYKSAYQMDQFKVIDLIAEIQPHIDQGISTVLHVNSDVSTRELARSYLKGEYTIMSAIKAVNWNRPDDDYSLMFWNQNIMQFWTDDEIPLSDDKMSWLTLSEIEKDSYMKVLGGLTLLDTIQGGVGMPQIMEHVDGLQRKAVLGFMGMMEQIHAKSYSSIFTTLASTEEIDGIFRWVEDNTFLQFKAETISEYYKKIESPKDLYLAMAASVLLESYLFYSGFFYPLYLAGQGKMTCSGEIIDLILRDESIHG